MVEKCSQLYGDGNNKLSRISNKEVKTQEMFFFVLTFSQKKCLVAAKTLQWCDAVMAFRFKFIFALKSSIQKLVLLYDFH